MSFHKNTSPSSKTGAIFLDKADEWRKIAVLNRRYGISNVVIEANIEAYRIASETNEVPQTPFTDNVVLQDIAHIIETGFPLFDSVFDIPDFVESERQRELEAYASMVKAEDEKRRAKKTAEEAELKRQKREALERELGVKLG